MKTSHDIITTPVTQPWQTRGRRREVHVVLTFELEDREYRRSELERMVLDRFRAVEGDTIESLWQRAL